MIDSHCHLDYCDDPEAAAAGVTALVSVGTNLERSRATVALAERFDHVFAAVGVHPNEASLARRPEIREGIEALTRHPKVVAVGETGFDTHWQKESLESQREAFDWHAELAARHDKALILHVRDRQGGNDASRAAAAALREVGYRRGVLHCFNGDPTLLEAGLELGWMVSFAGNLTYKNAKALHEHARSVPAEALMIETDSPFLTPQPKRGQRNVPANVRYTAAFLAELRGLEPGALEALTDANAIRFYRLPLA